MAMTRRKALLSAGTMAGASLLPLTSESTSGAGQQSASANQAPTEPVSLVEFEPIARERISHSAYEYISGGAGDELTLRWNREAFDRLRLRPRALVDVSRLDTRVKLFGQELPFPILLAPTAYHRLVHPEGELATVRGANAAEATMVISTAATISVEEIARASTRPVWFQLYVQRDRGFTREIVQRAEAAGCRALCVTADTPVIGTRNRESRLKFQLPPGLETPNLKRPDQATTGSFHRTGEREIYTALLDPTLTWKDIDWLRSFARVPVLLKGILNPDDADQAARAGVAGIIVSNHGARNLDTVPATVDALPMIVDRVAGRMPILVDGGIRRGTDVLKALALGASAVLIGRPYLYGLAAAGAEGVARVVNILRTEFETAMALTGRTSVASIERTVLWS